MAITYTLKYWTSSDTTRGKTERMHSRFSFDISKINKLNLSINKINKYMKKNPQQPAKD